MQRLFVLFFLGVLPVAAKAEGEFIKALPPGDFAASGLQKLTPEELTRLESLVQQFKKDDLADARRQAELRNAAAAETAEKKIAAAEARAGEAEARAAAVKAKETAAASSDASGKKAPRWFSALLTLNRANEKPEKEEALESRLVGDFSGWNGRTMFTLENGTRWLQQNKTESYAYAPKLHAPKVKIVPAAIRGFWLEIEGVNLNVRVMPFELVESK